MVRPAATPAGASQDSTATSTKLQNDDTSLSIGTSAQAAGLPRTVDASSKDKPDYRRWDDFTIDETKSMERLVNKAAKERVFPKIKFFNKNSETDIFSSTRTSMCYKASSNGKECC